MPDDDGRTIVCSQCGHTLSAQARFCRRCGNSVQSETSASSSRYDAAVGVEDRFCATREATASTTTGSGDPIAETPPSEDGLNNSITKALLSHPAEPLFRTWLRWWFFSAAFWWVAGAIKVIFVNLDHNVYIGRSPLSEISDEYFGSHGPIPFLALLLYSGIQALTFLLIARWLRRSLGWQAKVRPSNVIIVLTFAAVFIFAILWGLTTARIELALRTGYY